MINENKTRKKKKDDLRNNNNNYRVTFKELANKYMKKSIFEKYHRLFFQLPLEACLVYKSTCV